MTGGHNKTGNARRIAKKFAANIAYLIGVYVQNLATIGSFSKKLQQKDRWTQVRAPEHSRRQSLI